MKTLLSALLFAVAFAPSGLRSVEHPVRVRMNPTNPIAGQTVTITVDLSGEVEEDQSVAVSANSSYWSDKPSSIVVPAGFDCGSFSATIQTSPTGSSTITASCNGGYASASVPEN